MVREENRLMEKSRSMYSQDVPSNAFGKSERKPELIVTLNPGDPIPVHGSLAVPVEPFAAGFPQAFTVEDWRKLRLRTIEEGRKLYALLPGFVMEEDLDALEQLLLSLHDADGLYYGDEAVLMAARKTGYDGLMIFQPDTLICSSADVQAVKSMGADVVSLAHELSLEEVLAIAGKTDGLEVQIHGYYPVLSSRRKLLTAYGRTIGSSVIGEGQFSLQETTRPNRIPVLEQESGTVLFSPEPVQSLGQLPALLDAGIDRLRIDTRFLEPSDRNAALTAYQAVIDGGVAGMQLPGSDRTWRQQSAKTKEETQ